MDLILTILREVATILLVLSPFFIVPTIVAIIWNFIVPRFPKRIPSYEKLLADHKAFRSKIDQYKRLDERHREQIRSQGLLIQSLKEIAEAGGIDVLRQLREEVRYGMASGAVLIQFHRNFIEIDGEFHFKDSA